MILKYKYEYKRKGYIFNSKIVFITTSIDILTTNLLKRRIYKLTINKCLSTIHFIIFKIAWSFCSVLKVFNLRPVWISFVGWLMKYRLQMMINHIIRNMKSNDSQKINIYWFMLFNIFCDSHMYARLTFHVFSHQYHNFAIFFSSN